MPSPAVGATLCLAPERAIAKAVATALLHGSACDSASNMRIWATHNARTNNTDSELPGPSEGAGIWAKVLVRGVGWESAASAPQ